MARQSQATAAKMMTNSMLEGIICRQARPEDLRNVIRMADNISDGGDYLDFAYHAYITSTNVRCFAATSTGCIIAFVYMYVVDGGERVILGGGRTDPNLVATGVMGKLMKFGFQQLHEEKLITPTCLVLYKAFPTDAHRERFSKQPDRHQLLSQRCMADFMQPLSDFQCTARSRQRDRKGYIATMRRPSLEEFSDVFLCKQTIKRLFDEERMIISWIPLRADLINAKEVYNACIVQMSGEGRGRFCDAISFLFNIPCRLGADFRVDFYGTTYEQLEEHVLAGIEWISQGFSFTNSELHISLRVYYPCSMTSVVISSLANALGLKLGPLSKSYDGARPNIIACWGPVLPQESPVPRTLHSMKSHL